VFKKEAHMSGDTTCKWQWGPKSLAVELWRILTGEIEGRTNRFVQCGANRIPGYAPSAADHGPFGAAQSLLVSPPRQA